MFSSDDLRNIFVELKAIAMLWPIGASMELVDLTATWRDEYYKFWFEKWSGGSKDEW